MNEFIMLLFEKVLRFGQKHVLAPWTTAQEVFIMVVNAPNLGHNSGYVFPPGKNGGFGNSFSGKEILKGVQILDKMNVMKGPKLTCDLKNRQ